ncbi:unnamed protein product [Triticum turgidum subsp. durum]|uniref:Uncharacterized protein n=1 Tax=Triticum turgidum subsp. durum TaxID=4567 RepID=A0A9R1S9R5_TRITD|nr:unnamed protein product [Triticum turgidum subsp. durum]
MANSSPSSVAGGTTSHTASTIIAEGVSGSHDLSIKGYSRTKGLGIGECITSEKFDVGGHHWCIKYYPDGEAKDDTDSVALHLWRDDTDGNDVTAIFTFSLLNGEGQPVSLHSHSSGRRTFRPKQGWGFGTFIERNDLEDSPHLKDDCFSIRCDLTLTKEICTTRAAPFVVVPPSDMHRQLLYLLTSRHAGDVTFKVGRQRFTAHRYILAARSSVFMAELFGPMKEKEATCIHIHEVEAKVFKAMLHFIYTDELPQIDDGEAMVMAQHLLVAADRYNLDRLKLMCEETLCNYISKDTAATTLALAEQHGCDGLRRACFAFLASLDNLKAVMASDGFAHLRSSCPSIIEKLVTNLAPC